MSKMSVEQALLRAKSLERKGEVDQARALLKAVLDAFPNNKRAQQVMADLNRPTADASAATNPPPDQMNALIALYNSGQLAAVAKRARALVENFPSSFALWNIVGVASAQIGQSEQAVEAFRKAARLNQNHPDTHNNMGNALREQGKLDDAVASYRRALALKPNYAEAHNNMSVALQELGRLDDAAASCQRALAFMPDYPEAHYNMGNALMEQGKLDEAVTSYRRALALRPNYANVYGNMGNALRAQGKLNDAIMCYQRALALKPDYADAEARLLHLHQHICDWSNADQLVGACERLGITSKVIPPFSMLSIEDDAARQMMRSQTWARETYKQLPLPLPPKPNVRPERLRIGYFSADFHNHATLYLMAGLLRDHDAARFEIFAYSYGRSKGGECRQRAEGDVEHFFDVTDMSDRAVVDLARSHALDVAIDLKGYTQHTRSGLFQSRLAPVQVNFLGYPGTMGAQFMDYIIADPTVIPTDQRRFYTESVICLPYSYQPNDDAREVAATNTTRSNFDLPEEAFVFCCFNNNYKISPKEFDIWMRLLGKIDGSVLWLLKSNKWAEQNLKNEAAACGIAPSRLVFAERLPHAEHLARHTHADLFIDTFNYNAHTTASDALWAGLPVVTKQGQQFAARVAASLLNAVGLPELIVTTEQGYEALILDLAMNRDKLNGIREKLHTNRLSAPLFDTKRYTRNFECGLRQAYDLYFDGEAPREISVTE